MGSGLIGLQAEAFRMRQDDHMCSLLVVTGPPGSGKSTVSSLLVQRFERSALVEGDQFFAFLAEGRIEPWLAEAHSQNETAIEAAALAAGRFSADFDTVYDGVIGPWFIEQFAHSAAAATLDYVILLPPIEVCVERVRTRTRHGFSNEAATRQMHDQFASASIDERHVLRPGESCVESTVEQIEQARAEGQLRFDVPV